MLVKNNLLQGAGKAGRRADTAGATALEGVDEATFAHVGVT